MSIDRELYEMQPASEARNDDSAATCPGGVLLSDCLTASGLIESAIGEEREQAATKPSVINGEIWRSRTWMGEVCKQCASLCTVEVQTVDNQPTGTARISFYEPAACEEMPLGLA